MMGFIIAESVCWLTRLTLLLLQRECHYSEVYVPVFFFFYSSKQISLVAFSSFVAHGA